MNRCTCPTSLRLLGEHSAACATVRDDSLASHGEARDQDGDPLHRRPGREAAWRSPPIMKKKVSS